jgi:hypothetical protein
MAVATVARKSSKLLILLADASYGTQIGNLCGERPSRAFEVIIRLGAYFGDDFGQTRNRWLL